MEHFETLIKKASERETLTDQERAHMRSVIGEYAAMKPVRTSTAAPQAYYAWLIFLRRPAYAAFMALLVVGVAGGGVAYAAEGALPGDAFYGVKVSVTEPLRTALASDSSEKAALEMTFAERRLTEAATLANEGRLTSATEATLAVNFNTHTEAAAEAVQKTGDETDAEIAATTFADRLSAYDRVLSAAKKPAEATTTSALQLAINDQVRSLTPVRSEMMTTLAAPMAFSKATTASDTTATERAPAKDTQKLERAADAALRVTTDVVGNASSTLDASTSASVHAELDHVHALFDRARALLEVHDEDGARAAFRDSLSATSRLNVLTRAAADLKINVFTATGTDSDLKDAHERNIPVFEETATTSIESSATISPSSRGDMPGSEQDGEEKQDAREASTSRHFLPNLPFGL